MLLFVVVAVKTNDRPGWDSFILVDADMSIMPFDLPISTKEVVVVAWIRRRSCRGRPKLGLLLLACKMIDSE
jgi:hypothetical protein